MPRGHYLRRPRTSTNVEVLAVIPAATFTELSWWKKLTEPEQTAVISESQQLAGALQKFGQSRLEIGQHLTQLQAILEPHNLFQRYLNNFHFSKRTAYRYIAKFKNAQALPEPILVEAMARGMDVGGETELKPYGVYTEAVQKLPPPAAPTKEQAVTYLAQLDNVRKETTTATETGAGPVIQAIDPTVAAREVLSVFRNRFTRLPNNARTKANWVRTVLGMMLNVAGLATPQTVNPVAIPEDMQVRRGRPKVAAA